MPIFAAGNKRKHQSTAGFTLLELVVVLFIIALAASMVIPRLGENQGLLLKTETREIASLLRYARRMAMVKGQQMDVRLYPALQSDSESSSPTQRKAKILNPGEWRSRGSQLRWKAQEKQKTTEAEEEEDKPVVLHFYPAGGADGGTLTLLRGELEATIAINPLTGRFELKLPGDKD